MEMKNEITVNKNEIISRENSRKIAEFEKKIKELKEQEEELKKAILEEMEANNILKLETDELTISYVASFDKESFDSKRFREEHADMYDEYVKMTAVKPSIRIKVK